MLRLNGKSVTFRAGRAALVAIATAVVVLSLSTFAAIRSDQAAVQSGENAETLRRVIRSTHRIETIVKPVCVTAGREKQCERLLRSADERRVLRLCRLAARVLGSSGIEASCSVEESVKPPPTDRQQREGVVGNGGNHHPSGLGGSPSSEPQPPASGVGSTPPSPSEPQPREPGLTDSALDLLDPNRNIECHISVMGIRLCDRG